MITTSDIRNEVEKFEGAYSVYAKENNLLDFDSYLIEVVKITNENNGDEQDAIFIIEDTMSQFGIEA